MSSAGTSVNAKRTALVHFMFNSFGCLLFIAPLWIWKDSIASLFASMSNDVGQQIAIFHTLFNICTTLILLPIAQYVVKLVCLIIPDKNEEDDERFKFKFIDNRLLSTPPVAVGNTKNEIIRMSEFAKENINSAVEMLLDPEVDNCEAIRSNEEILNNYNKKITAFLTKLMSKDLSDEDDKKVGSYYHVVSDIERVGDYAENIMEYSLRLRKAELAFSDEAKDELREIVSKINNLYAVSVSAFDERNVNKLPEVDVLEQAIDDMSLELETRHIDRVKEGACTAELGSIYLQTVSNLERVGDHITNIAFSIRKYRHVDKKQ